MLRTPSQGDIWLVSFAEGAERPAVVVSRNQLNRGRLILVVPCTSAHVEERAKFQNHVALHRGEGGLTADSVAQCNLIQHVDVALLIARMGSLPRERLTDILLAIAWAIDLFETAGIESR